MGQEDDEKARKRVEDISGLCDAGVSHHLCWGEWTTPSAWVVCRCGCHKQAIEPVGRVMVAKGKGKIVAKSATKVLVKKK